MKTITTRTTSTPPALSGEQLTAAIRQEHEAASAAAGAALAHALEAGRLLAEARATISHGGWESYVRESCSIAPRTASLYLRLHRHRDRLPNRQHVADLSVRQAARLLERPRVKAEPVAAVAAGLRLQVPEWYRPGHWHAGGHHPSAWLFYVWPHPAGEPWVHAVTLEPVRRGTPVPEAIALGYDIDRTAAGPKRGIRIDAVPLILGMQAVNGMPPLSDPGWTIGAARLWSEERIAEEPSYNRWLFFSDDDYRRNGLGIMPARQGASS
jgi:hypothetical protein